MNRPFDAHFPTVANTPENRSKNVLAYQDTIKGTRTVLQASQMEKQPYEISFLGDTFVVYPNVFSPKYFSDSKQFAEHLPIKQGDEVLEIGPGTGVISITAMKRGTGRVVAVDINPDAVANTLENVRRFGLEKNIDVRLGDSYDAVNESEKFDVIFWNLPFGFVEEENLSALEKSVFDPEYKSTERFIREAHKYLKPNGHLYLGFSTTLGKLDMLTGIANDAGYNLRVLYKAESTEVHPVSYEIIEAVQKQL